MQYNLEHGQVVFCPFNDCLQPRDGSPVKLRHLEKLLLQALLSQMNDKREIIKYIWPKTIVSDGSYHKLVFDLRKQLSLVGVDPTLIKTIPRRGLLYNGHWSEKAPEQTEATLSRSDPKLSILPHDLNLETAPQLPEVKTASKEMVINATQVLKDCKNVTMTTGKLLTARISRTNPILSLLYCVCGTLSLASSLVIAVAW